jgi:integrase
MTAKNNRRTTINDYLLMISNIRKAYPTTAGPANISPGLAKNFITVRSEAGLSAYTIRGNIIKLSVIWAKWFIKECEVLSINPWSGIEKPKVDEPEPRYIEPAEEKAFFDWLSERWSGWRMPVLFFTVKGFTGRRITQLCSLPSSSLKDGRIAFPADINKSRRPEYARVPDAIFRELSELAGPTYIWERYPDELNAIYRKRGKPKYARCQEFRPERLKRFLQYEIIEYNRLNNGKPGFVPFTAHNFRDTAMTKAWDADIDLDRAAIAYGCNWETMKKHYIRKEALAVADAVFIRVQSRAAASTPLNGQHVENPGQSGKDSQNVVQPKVEQDRPAEGTG